MPYFDVKVIVEYEYQVEAEDEAQAEKEGWNYEEYAHHASVYSIDVEEAWEPNYSVEDDEEDE